ncbi:Ureohydrolase like protein, partial [Aduncisulcus paluster]
MCQKEDAHYGYMCLGIQKRSNTLALFKTAHQLGVQYILAKDMVDQDIWPIFEKVDKFIKKHDQLYITVCADVFSAAFAPGVSAAQAVGLHPEQVLKIIKYIVLSGKT